MLSKTDLPISRANGVEKSAIPVAGARDH